MAESYKFHDHEWPRITAQADRVAELIGEPDPERIMTYGTVGVILKPDQLDALLALITPKE